MVVDTSALIAVMLGEPETESFARLPSSEKEKTVEAIKVLSEAKNPDGVFVITEGSIHGFIDCLSRL